MTLMQLQIAVAAARTGSVSAAAAQLGISQPNASTAIRSVEKELGVKLFRRVSKGIAPTEHGYSFLNHASGLLKEYDVLTELKNEEPTFRLRLGIPNYTPPLDAFFRLCEELKDYSNAELSYVNLPAMKGVEMLSEYNLDLVATVLPDSYMSIVQKTLDDYKLSVIPICKASVNLKLREKHPVLENGPYEDFYELLAALGDYPYVDYQSQKTLEEMQQYRILRELKYRYRICVDSGDSRMGVVSRTNAFTVGSCSPKWQLEQYGIVQFPAPDIETSCLCFVRQGEEERREIMRYLELLRDVMETNF